MRFRTRVIMMEHLATANPAWLWVGSTALYAAMYVALNSLLVKEPEYAFLRPHLQVYVLSNLIKAVVLGMWGVMLWEIVFDVVVRDVWHTQTLRALAPIYAGLDLVSLVALRNRLHRSTLFHHVFVVLFAGVISGADVIERQLQEHNIQAELNTGKGSVLCSLCLYGLFSMLSYFVNAFLALRMLITPTVGNAKFNDAAARVCAGGYAAICAFHWWFQVKVAIEYEYVPWLAIYVFFVTDDLVLMHKLAVYRAPTRRRSAGRGASTSSDDADPASDPASPKPCCLRD